MSRPLQSGEFALIRNFFSSGYPKSADTILGVGDDCSIISVRSNFDLVQSIDTQVADVHFPAAAPAHLIAARALRCAASDLAAMGAIPQGFHLALTLPNFNAEWLMDFSRGLKETAHALNLDLLGGDTTRGKQLVITISVQGWVQHGKSLRRDQAKIGDDIWITDSIGKAALALNEVLKNPSNTEGFAHAYYYPPIQFTLGQALVPLAHTCMDISDGLLQDAGHIANASNVTLVFDAHSIPTAVEPSHANWWQCLSGGDDYQLLFTAPTNNRTAIADLNAKFCTVTRIGHVTNPQNSAVIMMHNNKILSMPEQIGFQHF